VPIKVNMTSAIIRAVSSLNSMNKLHKVTCFCI